MVRIPPAARAEAHPDYGCVTAAFFAQVELLNNEGVHVVVWKIWTTKSVFVYIL